MIRAVATVLVCCAALGLAGTAAGDGSEPRGGRSKGITMSHATLAHSQLACIACHARAESSRNAGDSLMPTEQSCAPCHAAQVRPARPGATTCGKCHDALGSGGVPVARLPEPAADLHFSHRAHLLRGTPCNTCHTPDGRGMPSMPSMTGCLSCHRAQRASSCRRCHVSEPSGRLRGGDRALIPRGALMGMAHDADWIVRHRWVGADRGEICASCHEERDCVRCHDGRLQSLRIHPGDYLPLHAQEARRNTTRCQSCHSTQTFCGECHSRLGLATFAPPELRSSRRYHPPAAVWSRGLAAHAMEARRDLSSCTTCHAERDCVQCHGTTGVGGMGRSPHPAGYARRCGAEIAANSRACVTCHGDASELRKRCR